MFGHQFEQAFTQWPLVVGTGNHERVGGRGAGVGFQDLGFRVSGGGVQGPCGQHARLTQRWHRMPPASSWGAGGRWRWWARLVQHMPWLPLKPWNLGPCRTGPAPATRSGTQPTPVRGLGPTSVMCALDSRSTPETRCTLDPRVRGLGPTRSGCSLDPRSTPGHVYSRSTFHTRPRVF